MGVASEGRGQRGAWRTHFHSPIPSAPPPLLRRAWAPTSLPACVGSLLSFQA